MTDAKVSRLGFLRGLLGSLLLMGTRYARTAGERQPVAPPDRTNGDEARYGAAGNANVNYTKGLRRRGDDVLQDQGDVAPKAYDALRAALDDHSAEEFQRLRIAGLAGAPLHPSRLPALPLLNPLANPDTDFNDPELRAYAGEPPPNFAGDVMAAEAAELYWMALLRDVPLAAGPDARNGMGLSLRDARDDLAAHYRFFAQFYGAGHPLPLAHLFKVALPGRPAAFPGVADGPLVSQFLLRGTRGERAGDESQGIVTVGGMEVHQRQRTVLDDPSKSDFLTNREEWRDVQEGTNRTGGDSFDYRNPRPAGIQREAAGPQDSLRFVRSPRDLASLVHTAGPSQPFLAAFAILLSEATRRSNGSGWPALLNVGSPYRTASPSDATLAALTRDFETSLAEAANRATAATFYQKWYVHRRIRPEEFAGRVHFSLRDPAVARKYRIHDELLRSAASGVLHHINAHNKRFKGDDTHLLPQAYPEGCPLHPAYPASHAVVAGVAATLLKAFFNERSVLASYAAVADAAPIYLPDGEGKALLPVSGRAKLSLTVGGELNKLASNIAFARSMAGLHWRSDNVQGLLLGEDVAITYLSEKSRVPLKGMNDHKRSFLLTKFDTTLTKIVQGTVASVVPDGR